MSLGRCGAPKMEVGHSAKLEGNLRTRTCKMLKFRGQSPSLAFFFLACQVVSIARPKPPEVGVSALAAGGYVCGPGGWRLRSPEYGNRKGQGNTFRESETMPEH